MRRFSHEALARWTSGSSTYKSILVIAFCHFPSKAEFPHLSWALSQVPNPTIPGTRYIQLICAFPPFLIAICKLPTSSKERLAVEEEPGFCVQETKWYLGISPTTVKKIMEKNI